MLGCMVAGETERGIGPGRPRGSSARLASFGPGNPLKQVRFWRWGSRE